MVDAEQYDAAVARCEAIAKDHGHVLGAWYPVDEQLHASMCDECGKMAWVIRPGNEERWRVGGDALRQDCAGEEWKRASTTAHKHSRCG